MTPIYPEEFNSWLEEAGRLAAAGQIAVVGRLLEAAAEQFPNSPEILAHLGYFYYKSGRYSRALEVFSVREKRTAPDVGVCKILAEIHLSRREGKSARHWLQRARALGNRESGHFRRLLSTFGCDFFAYVRKTARILFRSQSWARCPILFVISLMNRLLRMLVRVTEKYYAKKLTPEAGEFPFQLHAFLSFLAQFDPESPRCFHAYHKNREALVASRALPTNNARALILDIGTGKNILPLFWASQGPTVIALDGSLYGMRYLQQARANMESREIHSVSFFIASDGRKLPFRSDQFDGVSCICALEHIPDDGDMECLAEIFRVTRPGGKAVITVECSATTSECWMEVPYEIGYQIDSASTAEPHPTAWAWNEVFCRNYSPSDGIERLVRSAPWVVLDSGFYDDTSLPCRRWLDPLRHPFLSRFLRSFQPLLALWFYRKTNQNAALSPSSIGYLVLQKPVV